VIRDLIALSFSSSVAVCFNSREAAKNAKFGIVTCNSLSHLAVLKLRS